MGSKKERGDSRGERRFVDLPRQGKEEEKEEGQREEGEASHWREKRPRTCIGGRATIRTPKLGAVFKGG